MHGIILTLHILAACVWTGGHIVLAVGILPGVLANKDIDFLSRFESSYEKVGLPALLIQIVSGLYLAQELLPAPLQWFNLENPVARLICVKISLLLLTACFALHARLRIIPNLSPNNVGLLALHIIPVTLISVAFVIVGVSFRMTWFY